MNTFNIGDNIIIQGNKGVIADIDYCKLFSVKYGDYDNGETCLSEKQASDLLSKGYTLTDMGETATYYKVRFVNELSGTAYNGKWYGCLDKFNNYGRW